MVAIKNSYFSSLWFVIPTFGPKLTVMLSGDYQLLYRALTQKIEPTRIFHDPLHTLAFGTDASFYRMIPKIVVKAKDEEEVAYILREADKRNIAVTFRAAGTSLSGQAISDSVLVIAGEHWKNFEILDEGLKIRLQPGLIGSKVNRLLAPFGRKIGPDPASIHAAMIGGIAANNASGMCCGTADNSYKTVAGIRVILHDGTILDTTDEQSRQSFLKSHSVLAEALDRMAAEVKSNTVLANRIRNKFKIKNTTGYSLNALTDFDNSFDIIEHLMIGSEGTLGFIAGITYRTVVEHPFKASAVMVFPDIINACKAVRILKNQPVSTAELMDRAGLRSVEKEPGLPVWLPVLSEGATALLVETRAGTKAELDNQIQTIANSLETIPKEIPLYFTENPAEYNLYWKIRKGLFPSVGAVRKTGTTVIIEDVAFPIDRLAEATTDLQTLFLKYRYDEAVIFGHALDGNLHFVFTQDFGTSQEVERYERFMADVASLVVEKYDGSLKAEHGTGRNMAPFVEKEWGREAYQLMQQIKKMFDPKNLLNPGVIINPDPDAHIKNLKPLPAASEKVDKCIECGFCEPSCVSAELTLSPRQRIAVYREISRLKTTGEEPHVAASLVTNFNYSGNETCATDGLCAVACPVKIDTGKLIKDLRHDAISPKAAQRAIWLANNMKSITAIGRPVLSLVNMAHSVLGTTLMSGIAGGMRKISGNQIPLWTAAMPSGAKRVILTKYSKSDNKVVYFPSCINRTMGVSKDHKEEKQLSETLINLIHKAGFEVVFPDGLSNLCCGMAFSSKGYKEAGLMKSKELEAALWKASGEGRYPIVCDMSPCLYTMKENMEPRIKLYEPVEFILNYLVDKLDFNPVDEAVAVFPVCSMKKMGMDEKLAELARRCSREVVVPETNCCGFAGDRGFTYPELNHHGLRELKEQIPSKVKQGYSTSRTCEIGLTHNSGISFKSIVYLVDKVTTRKN